MKNKEYFWLFKKSFEFFKAGKSGSTVFHRIKDRGVYRP